MGFVLLILITLVGVGRLWSQPKKEPAVPHTRIGIINLAYVIKNYDKWKVFSAEIKEEIQRGEERVKGKQAQILELQKEALEPGLPAEKVLEIKQKVEKLEADLKKQTEEAKAYFAKISDKQMVGIYKDVQLAGERYAKAHDLELILHFNDAIEEAEFDNPMNVARKMNAGGCTPLYAVRGIDVSQGVLAILNDKPCP
jgi:Skp family chaperone for outer membrane proteins